MFPDVVLIFLVDLGGKGDWPDVGCLTAFITVNRSDDLMRLKLVVVSLGYRRLVALCSGHSELWYRVNCFVLL